MQFNLTSTQKNFHIETLIDNKQVFVNDNPFKQEVGKIYNYLM